EIGDASGHPRGYALLSNKEYTARISIAQGGGAHPMSLEKKIAIERVGELVIEVHRSDNTPLPARAQIELTRVRDSQKTSHTTAACTAPLTRDEAVVFGLEPGEYRVQVKNVDAVRGAYPRMGPDRLGRASVRLREGAQAKVS